MKDPDATCALSAALVDDIAEQFDKKANICSAYRDPTAAVAFRTCANILRRYAGFPERIAYEDAHDILGMRT